MTLTPNLTDLDRRVLDAVKQPRRTSEVCTVIYGRADSEGAWSEVDEILRGLAHLGCVARRRGGWWQAT
jgi:hypothetical protein